MKALIYLIVVFALVIPIKSMPIHEDDFDEDDPDQGEFEDNEYYSNNVQENDVEDEHNVDEDFAAAKRAYEELQIEIRKMEETLNKWKKNEISEEYKLSGEKLQDMTVPDQLPQMYNERENDENAASENDRNTELEFGNFNQNTNVYEDDEDDKDTLAEDATQDAVQGNIGEDEDESREEIDALQRDEGNNKESNGYLEKEIQDDMNDSRDEETNEDEQSDQSYTDDDY